MTITRLLKKIIRSFNFTARKTINNVTFSIPVLNSIGTLNMRTHELWMIQLMKLLITSKDNTFIDVGANVGQTLLKIKSIYPDMPYYGFEPNPVCNFYIQRLIKANKIKKAKLYPVGLGAEINFLEFFIFDETDAASSSGTTIGDLFEKEPVSTELIPIFSLDYFKDTLLSGKTIDLIKVDVENGELEVLKGGLKTIQQFQPFIITEILPIINSTTIAKTNERKAEMQKIMEEIGYSYYRVVLSPKGEFTGFRPVTDVVTDSYEESKIQYDFNYLIAPASKNDFLKKYIV